MKVYVLENNLRSFLGHFFNATIGLKQAFTAQGIDSIIAVHQQATPKTLHSLGGQPIFKDLSWASEGRPVGNADYYGQSFANDLAQLTVLQSNVLQSNVLQSNVPQPEDWLLATTASQDQVLGLAMYLETLAIHQRPKVLVYVHWNNWDNRPDLAQAWKVACNRLAQATGPGRFIVAVTNDCLREQFTQMSGYSAETWPIPAYYGSRQPIQPKLAQAPIRIAALGRNLKRKGSHFLFSIVTQVKRRRPQTEFLIQVSPNMLYLAILGGLPGVEIMLGGSNAERHLKALNQSDIILMPYLPQDYIDRTSGLLMEAGALGKLVVVPRGTWLAEQIELGRATGIAFEQHNAQNITNAIVQAIDQFAGLNKQASDCADYWWKHQSSQAFVRCLLARDNQDALVAQSPMA